MTEETMEEADRLEMVLRAFVATLRRRTAYQNPFYVKIYTDETIAEYLPLLREAVNGEDT